MTKLQELIKLADAATPGPWEVDQRICLVRESNGGHTVKSQPCNLSFIAAANPATIKRMAELLVQCREALSAMDNDDWDLSDAAMKALAALDAFDG